MSSRPTPLPLHDIYKVKLESETGEVMLETTLHVHPYMRDELISEDEKDATFADICDTSSSKPCLYKHASDLGLLDQEVSAREHKLKLYYPVRFEDGITSFNISRTENRDGGILEKPVLFSADDLELGRVEKDVQINSKKCKVVVEHKWNSQKVCKCTRKLSRAHCIESALRQV